MDNHALLKILQDVKNKSLTIDAAVKALLQPSEKVVADIELNKMPTVSYSELLYEDLKREVVALLKLQDHEFSLDTSFIDFGIDSITATEFANTLNKRYQLDISPTLFFEFTSLRSFAAYLLEQHELAITAYFKDQIASPPDYAKTIAATQQTVAINHKANNEIINNMALDIDALWQQAEQGILPNAEVLPSSNNQDVLTVEADLLLISKPGQPDIEVAITGQGQPLLLLGGLLMPHHAWKHQVDALANSYKLIMLNQPGCGRSGIDKTNFTLATIIQTICTVLDFLQITTPIPVIGYSFGGLLAQQLCLQHPGRVSALVIACSTADTTSLSQDFEKLIREVSDIKEVMVLNRSLNMSLLPVYGMLMKAFNVTAQLSHIQAPCLVIAAANDGYMLPDYARAMQRLLPYAEYKEIANAKHLAAISHYQEFNQLLIEFLTKIQGASRIVKPAMSIVAKPIKPAFKPAKKSTLQVLENYIHEQAISFCAILSPLAAQLGYLLNKLIQNGREDIPDYKCFFLTSYLEALDAGLRLARHKARNSNPQSRGHILIYDPNSLLSDYFNPLQVESQKALVPGLNFFAASETLMQTLQGNTAYAAVVLSAQLPMQTIHTIFTLCRQKNIITILVEDQELAAKNELCASKIDLLVDIIIFGENWIDRQLPFGVCAVKEGVHIPWSKAPFDGSVRNIFAVYGPVLALAKELLLKQNSAVSKNAVVKNYLQQIENNQQTTIEAHTRYVNPGFVEAAKIYGWHGRFTEAAGTYFAVTLADKKRPVIDALANVSTCPRGHNPSDISANVLQAHHKNHDYWQELANYLTEKTGFAQAFPAVSNSTAVEVAIILSLLANPTKTRLVFFVGGHGWTLITAASASDGKRNAFMQPFLPLYFDSVFIDPHTESGLETLKQELSSGKINLIWLETIPVEFGGVRPLPEKVLQIINDYQPQYNFNVGIDETSTNLVTGKLLNYSGKIHSPDLVAMASVLGDAILPAGLVLTNEATFQRALQTNAILTQRLQSYFCNQLGAHIALNMLRATETHALIKNAQKVGEFFKTELMQLAKRYTHIKEIRGEGLIIAMQFALADQHPFIQQWFGYLFWGACLRMGDVGVALSACPLHADTVKLTPALTFSKQNVKTVISTLKAVLAKGIHGIIEEAASFNREQDNQKMADYLLQMSHLKTSAITSNVVETPL